MRKNGALETRLSHIHHKNENQTFGEFLIQEKEAMGISWRILSEHVGIKRVDAYSFPAGKRSTPNRPTYEKFQQIIEALGYEENEFDIEKTSIINRKHLTTDSVLREIGDVILEMKQENKGKGYNFSTTIIKKIAGDHFYQTKADTVEKREGLVQRLQGLNRKYSKIELVSQDHSVKIYNPLTPAEAEIVEAASLEYVSQHPTNHSNSLPSGIIGYVRDQLSGLPSSEKVPNRSKGSIQHHIRQALDIKKRYKVDNYVRE